MGKGGPATADSSGAGSSCLPYNHEAWIQQLVKDHFNFVWRSLRRLGVAEANVLDAAQEVFLVASRRMTPSSCYPHATNGLSSAEHTNSTNSTTSTNSKDRAFLFAVVLRVAWNERRTRRRHPDTAASEDWPDAPDQRPGPEELTARLQARVVLDRILADLPLDVRAVFILFELEEMSIREIAHMLALPLGTVSSRLRRGRELFDAAVSRHQARGGRGGAT